MTVNVVRVLIMADVSNCSMAMSPASTARRDTLVSEYYTAGMLQMGEARFMTP